MHTRNINIYNNMCDCFAFRGWVSCPGVRDFRGRTTFRSDSPFAFFMRHYTRVAWPWKSFAPILSLARPPYSIPSSWGMCRIDVVVVTIDIAGKKGIEGKKSMRSHVTYFRSQGPFPGFARGVISLAYVPRSFSNRVWFYLNAGVRAQTNCFHWK